MSKLNEKFEDLRLSVKAKTSKNYKQALALLDEYDDYKNEADWVNNSEYYNKKIDERKGMKLVDVETLEPTIKKRQSIENSLIELIDKDPDILLIQDKNEAGYSLGMYMAMRKMEDGVLKALDYEKVGRIQNDFGQNLGQFCAAYELEKATLKSMNDDIALTQKDIDDKTIATISAENGLVRPVKKYFDICPYDDLYNTYRCQDRYSVTTRKIFDAKKDLYGVDEDLFDIAMNTFTYHSFVGQAITHENTREFAFKKVKDMAINGQLEIDVETKNKLTKEMEDKNKKEITKEDLEIAKSNFDDAIRSIISGVSQTLEGSKSSNTGDEKMAQNLSDLAISTLEADTQNEEFDADIKTTQLDDVNSEME